MSGLETALRTLGDRLRDHSETIATEEAAKTSIVLPFLSSLGYDVFNPAEVIPEFTADAVGKKGEKVDHAIKLDGEIRILVECKGLNTKLDKTHLSQLFRYFSVTKARFAVLTNGKTYQFHTDLDEPNKLDPRPFFSFDLLDFSPSSLIELQKFDRSTFNVDNILATAERLKYVSAIKNHLNEVLDNPSEEVVRLVANKVYEGRLTAQAREMIGGAIKTAFREIIRDAVQARLSSALESTGKAESVEKIEPASEPDEIETTQEETEGTLIIKSIVRDVIKASRVNLRDSKSYCAVLIDDNNRKPLARLHFNRSRKYIELFDTEKSERLEIDGLDDIYQYGDRLRSTAEKYKDG
jgi:hypothetical protein